MRTDRLPQFDGPGILVEVAGTAGSTPREAGAFMVVTSTLTWGTIGGGNMEFRAVDMARSMLLSAQTANELDVVLGPESGQCCGGRVRLTFCLFDASRREALEQRLKAAAREYSDIFIFGAGHVGRALCRSLEALPFNVTVVETRPEEFSLLPEGANARLVAIPEAEIAAIRPGGAAVILTHDHGLDFLIGAEALKRPDLRYVGMIGSRTKRAVFASWLERNGHEKELAASLVLPIGGSAVRDKRPEVIAALVTAELITALMGQG